MSRPSRQHAAGVGCFEAGRHPQQRGLAAARRAEQREHFALADFERDRIDGGEAVEALGDVFEAEVPGHGTGGMTAESGGVVDGNRQRNSRSLGLDGFLIWRPEAACKSISKLRHLASHAGASDCKKNKPRPGPFNPGSAGTSRSSAGRAPRWRIGLLAATARLAGALVDEQLLAEVARLAVGAEEVAQGGAACLDRSASTAPDRGDQPGEPRPRHPVGGGPRPDAGAEQRLAGVDVAHPDDHLGVHDHQLDRRARDRGMRPSDGRRETPPTTVPARGRAAAGGRAGRLPCRWRNTRTGAGRGNGAAGRTRR